MLMRLIGGRRISGMGDDALTFLASIAPLQSAITIASDGGARVKIDIPEDEMPAIVRLMLMRGKVLRVTVGLADAPQATTNVIGWRERKH
jgi:hypothetical protein